MENGTAPGVKRARREIVKLPDRPTMNPYAELLYGALAERGFHLARPFKLSTASLWRSRRTVGYLHFHWRLHRCYAPCLGEQESVSDGLRLARAGIQLLRFAMHLAWARVLGYRIVWTIHEWPRSRGRMAERIERVGQTLLARASDVLLTHHAAVADKMQRELGRSLQVAIIPHGHFRGVYPQGRPGNAVRAELGLPTDAFVFLAFGHTRMDKQFDLLLEAFDSLDLPDARLVFAGRRGSEAMVERLQEAALRDARIRVIEDSVPHERVRELFEMADAFVLARSEVWTSGSLVLALSLGLPLITAELEPTKDLLGNRDAGWLFKPGDVESLAGVMRAAAIDRAAAAEKRAAARLRGAELPSWEDVARQTAALISRQGSEQGGEALAHTFDRKVSGAFAASAGQLTPEG